MGRFTSVTSLMIVCMGFTTVQAGRIIYPLPELIGEYSYSDLSMVPVRRANYDTGVYSYWIGSAQVVLIGSVTSGLIRGDGVQVPAGDFVLKGGFNITLATPGATMGEIPTASQDGAFRMERTYTEHLQPKVTPMPGSGDRSDFFGCVSVVLDVAAWQMNLPPRLAPPDESFYMWWEGYDMTSPLMGTITDAYMVIEGPTLPEPSVWCLVAVAPVALCLRRRGQIA
jgi:hypothetical protein